MTPWEIRADEFVSCNCAYGCPCQFNAPPTHGNCQAMSGFSIKQGHFGDVKLDGLHAVGVFKWPKAIHEGNGECVIVIDERADEAQRNAILTIMSGEETDPFATVFNVFASTMVKVHDPLFEPIEMEIDVEARAGTIKVTDLMEARGAPIRNPISGEEHRVRIDLVGGFEYQIAEIGSTTFKTAGPIELDWKETYAQFAHIHLDNHGIVEPHGRLTPS